MVKKSGKIYRFNIRIESHAALVESVSENELYEG